MKTYLRKLTYENLLTKTYLRKLAYENLLTKTYLRKLTKKLMNEKTYLTFLSEVTKRRCLAAYVRGRDVQEGRGGVRVEKDGGIVLNFTRRRVVKRRKTTATAVKLLGHEREKTVNVSELQAKEKIYYYCRQQEFNCNLFIQFSETTQLNFFTKEHNIN